MVIPSSRANDEKGIYEVSGLIPPSYCYKNDNHTLYTKHSIWLFVCGKVIMLWIDIYKEDCLIMNLASSPLWDDAEVTRSSRHKPHKIELVACNNALL